MNSAPEILCLPHPRGEIVLRLQPDLSAHAEAAENAADDEATVAHLGEYRVLQRPVTAKSRSGELPVYRDPGGEICIATGRIWVRFAAGVDLVSREAELGARGFTVDSVTAHAPETGWVVAKNGVGDALARYCELGAIADCEHVEPQLLRARGTR